MYGNKVFVCGVAIVLGLAGLLGEVAGLPVLKLGQLVVVIGAVLVVFDK